MNTQTISSLKKKKRSKRVSKLIKICADVQILPMEQCRMEKNQSEMLFVIVQTCKYCLCFLKQSNSLCCSSYAFTTYQALPGFHIIVG